MEMERHFSGEIAVVLSDGSRLPAKVLADEISDAQRAFLRISFQLGDEVKFAESEHSFFGALIQLRLELEKTGRLLCCFGASENVYPSGMSLSMGTGILAHKTYLGLQGELKDIVNIFEADETVNPSTIEEQKLFHDKWIESLSKRQQ